MKHAAKRWKNKISRLFIYYAALGKTKGGRVAKVAALVKNKRCDKIERI